MTLQQRIDAFIASDVNLSPAQREIVVAPDRVIVVRACPGAGKTRVFATRYAKEAAEWRGRPGGIAALSFTNVAQREVQRRVVQLGVPSGHPHFIGTIDAFLLRFVVKRFGGEIVNLGRFVRPYGVGEYGIQMAQLQASDDPRSVRRLSEFVIRPSSGGGVGVFVQAKDGKEGIWRQTTSARATQVVEAKRAAWLASGELTYADVCAVAWGLLRDDSLRDIVGARFPVILVDEFQDTTDLRAPCLRRLMEGQHCRRALVVGDPDQRIMTFAGAHPQLFEDFEGLAGARSYTLSESRRAHGGITAVASFLRNTPTPITSAVARPVEAAVVLASHSHSPREKSIADVPAFFKTQMKAVGAPPGGAVILAWAEADVRRLGGGGWSACPFSLEAVRQLVGAVRSRYRGNLLEAVDGIESIVSRIVLGHRQPQSGDLASLGLTPRAWRGALLSLLRSIEPIAGENVGTWLGRAKGCLGDAVSALSGTTTKVGHQISTRVAAGRNKEKVLAADAAVFLGNPVGEDGDGLRILRVHQVKGEEFDTVCLYIPKPEKGEPGACATLLGEPESPAAEEGRRVAFVGMTRAIRHLVIVLPADWVAELEGSSTGKKFLQAFDKVAEVGEPQ